jgi:hypothetical protein
MYMHRSQPQSERELASEEETPFIMNKTTRQCLYGTFWYGLTRLDLVLMRSAQQVRLESLIRRDDTL